jgi:hypothetical protein
MRTLFFRLDRLRTNCSGSLQYSSLALLLAIAAIAVFSWTGGHFPN